MKEQIEPYKHWEKDTLVNKTHLSKNTQQDAVWGAGGYTVSTLLQSTVSSQHPLANT